MKNIAIDGPSGAGKSTISRRLAKELGFIYIDTGALYRAVGLYIYQKGVNPKSPEAVTPFLPEMDIKLSHDENGLQRIFLNGVDVSEAIRQNEISMFASDVSAIPEVRSFLLNLQRNIAQSNNVIMDGRDIGTVILPDADVKIFLTAESRDRAKRRYDELLLRGQAIEYEEICREIAKRDENDSARAAAPLKKADDAELIDTTGCSAEEGYKKVADFVRAKLKI